MNKSLMIKQGYVPSTCVLHEDLAGVLIWAEILMGRDPCAGCNHDRAVCRGRPNTVALKKSFGPGPENDLARLGREDANREEIRKHEERLAEDRERLRREDEVYGKIHGLHEVINEESRHAETRYCWKEEIHPSLSRRREAEAHDIPR